MMKVSWTHSYVYHDMMVFFMNALFVGIMLSSSSSSSSLLSFGMVGVNGALLSSSDVSFFGILSNQTMGQGSFRCGVVLVHDDIALTGSFCSLVGDVVRLGYQNDTHAMAYRTVLDYVTHPSAGGNQENWPNDLEVIKLNETVKNIIEPIRINAISAIPPDNKKPVFYAHAGAYPDVGPDPYILGSSPLTTSFSNHVIVRNATTVQNRICRQAYINQVPYYQTRLHPSIQFCTTTDNEVGPCDSAAWGSPLWVKDTNTLTTTTSTTPTRSLLLVGLASQGSCKAGNPPYIWTRVAFYASWIQEQICTLSNTPPASCVNKP